MTATAYRDSIMLMVSIFERKVTQVVVLLWLLLLLLLLLLGVVALAVAVAFAFAVAVAVTDTFRMGGITKAIPPFFCRV